MMERGELLQGESVDERERSEEKQHRHETLVAAEVVDGAPEEHEQQTCRVREPTRDLEEEQLRSVKITAGTSLVKENGDTQARGGAELGGRRQFEEELQRQLALKEREIDSVLKIQLAESEMKWAAQLEAVEASRQEQAAEFTAEIEQLKLQCSEEVKSVLMACRQAREELEALKKQQVKEVQHMLAESERVHNAEIQVLRDELDKLRAERDKQEERGNEKWESLLPQHSPHLSPQMQKELRLLKERLQRQHNCELKAQERTLRNELSLEIDALQAKVEEEYTGKLAKVLTESALKNALQVEQISQQLRLEKQRAVSVLEEAQTAMHEQEVARLLEERREAVETCRTELESARIEYQSKIADLEVALASEREKRMATLTEQYQEDWLEREERLRREMEIEYRRRVEEAQAECDREKENALMSLREALEERLQTELRAAHEIHEQALRENQTQLQSTYMYEKEVAAMRESAHTMPIQPQEDGQHEDAHVETLRAQIVKEHMARFQGMIEKLQAVHQAELVAMQREREAESCRHQEEVGCVREMMETRIHQELEQLTHSHKTEVGLLQQKYQIQLDEMTALHQHELAQERDSVEGSVRSALTQQWEARLRETQQQHNSQLEQLQNKHSAQITMVEEEGAERLAKVGRELEEVREHSKILETQVSNLKRELSEVQAVAEQQRAVLNRQEEERQRLGREAGAREREREEQGDREHREDTASLAILQKQLSDLTAEKSALQSSLAVLQSSVAGCVQLASLVEQTLSLPSTSLPTDHWHTPTAWHASVAEQSSSQKDSNDGEEAEVEGEDTLTPPTTVSPGSAVVSMASSSSAVVKSATNLRSGSMLRHTPSDDSGLASQQASVVNSEVITPLVDGLEAHSITPVASLHSPHPPNLTILPLDATTLSPDRSQAPQPGLSYDQSQVGMLSISFLDATQYPSHPHSSHPHPPPAVPPTQSGELSIPSLEQSLQPVTLSDLPALQEGLSHLHEAVSTLLQQYISVSAQAADYQQKWVTSTTQLREILSSQGVLDGRVSELESEARLREERLEHTTQQMAAAQDNLQGAVREIEETKTEKEGLRQQLMATQEALTASQQRETEIQTLLREKIEDSDSQKHVFESRESESQQRLQVLETQTVQLQEELQAAQRNCASAIHEREAIHEENKKLTSVRVTLEGRLHGLREEATAREREWEQKLKQKEDEIRELQAVRVELSSRQEAEERLRAERNELQQRLGNVEHQLALCQVVPVEEQMSRIQKLTSREAQLSAELREQAATCQALGERVRVAQDSLNQTAQENLNLKIGQAQLEGEVQRLRGELQRRETAIHRVEAQSTSQARELSAALEELSLLRGRLHGERKEEEEESSESGVEGELCDPPQEESTNDMVLSLQRELQQQREMEGSLQTQMGLLRDTLNSKDRELEAMRMARSHQERVLQQLRTQLSAKEKEAGSDQVEYKEERTLQQVHSTQHSAHSSTSTVLEQDGGFQSILVRLAELAPILSQEAHTVNQLTKNIQFPILNVEQLRAAIDGLSQVIETLSVQSEGDGSGRRWSGILGAVQKLVQELTDLLSHLDHGSNLQLPQQLSAVGELLSQLLSVDREALVKDTNTLRETVATLQAQLQHQSEVVSSKTDEEYAQLRSKLEDAEGLLEQDNEMNAQLRALLDKEVSQTAQLRNEQLATQDVISQLETEVKGLQTLLSSVTSELEEAQSRLTEYKQTEDSLERSAHTISSLHQELRSSKEREAELETALQEVSISQSELEQQYSTAQVQHTAALTSIQAALQLERTTKDKVYAQLLEVQSQLQQAEGARQSGEAGGRQLRVRLEEKERELGRARDVGRRAEEVCGERDAELSGVQVHLHTLETDNQEQRDHYNHLLNNEHRMVVSLRSSLQAKERELTETMDRFLQEKVGAAKAQGELAATRARLETAQQHIASLQNKVSSLHAEGESKAGDDTIRQLEVDQLRRQLYHLQTSSEQQSGTALELMHEKLQLQSTVSRLLAQVTSLQKNSSRDRDDMRELRNVLGNREEEVSRLQQQLTSLQTATCVSLPEDLLQAKLMRLYAKYREAEVHRKALVFQKNYLKCQVDAFFQTQQTALIMMADMGAPLANTTKSKSPRSHLLKFKTVAHAVMAALRFLYVVRRKHQYIQSYSNRIEREKASLRVCVTVPHSISDPHSIRPASSIKIPLSSVPLQCPSTTSAAATASPSPHTLSTPSSRSSLPLHPGAIPTQPKLMSTRHSQHGQTNSQATSHATTRIEPPLSAYIPSLARLQAKLSDTVN